MKTENQKNRRHVITSNEIMPNWQNEITPSEIKPKIINNAQEEININTPNFNEHKTQLKILHLCLVSL